MSRKPVCTNGKPCKEMTRRGFLSLTGSTVFMPTLAGILMRSRLGHAETSGGRWVYIEHGGGGGRDHAVTAIMPVDQGGVPLASQSNMGGITTVTQQYCAPGVYLKTGANTLFNSLDTNLSAAAKVAGVVQVAAFHGNINTDGNNQIGIGQAVADAIARNRTDAVPFTGSAGEASGSGAGNNLKEISGFAPVAVRNLNDIAALVSVQAGALSAASPQTLSSIANTLKKMSESTFNSWASVTMGSVAFREAFSGALEKSTKAIGTPAPSFDPRTDPVFTTAFGINAQTANNDPVCVYAGKLKLMLDNGAEGTPPAGVMGEDLGGTDSHNQAGGTGWLGNNVRDFDQRLVPAINAIVAKGQAAAAAGEPVTKAVFCLIGAGAHSFTGNVNNGNNAGNGGAIAQGDDAGKTTTLLIIVDPTAQTVLARGQRGYYATGQNVDTRSWMGGNNLTVHGGAVFATVADLIDPNGGLANRLSQSAAIAALSLRRA